MKKIKLTQNKYALVDGEDFEMVNQFKWYAHFAYNNWYATRQSKRINGKQTTQLMHRFIMNTPDGMGTDHKNHNGLDNQKSNLRVCTQSENQRNRQLRQNTTSKYKGVCWNKWKNKWMAAIKLNGKRIHLGYFTNEVEAALIYNIKAKKIFNEFAYLNFK